MKTKMEIAEKILSLMEEADFLGPYDGHAELYEWAAGEMGREADEITAEDVVERMVKTCLELA